MSIRHHLITLRNGSICGISLFIEGRRPTVTIVVTELPDNPGTSARDAFADAVLKVRRAALKGIPEDKIAYVYRIPASEQQREVMIRAFFEESSGLVDRWEHMNPVQLGQLVNRDGGFVRRAVFIPAFRPVDKVRARGQPQEIVEYVTT
jgi:hypothetical protein